MVWPGVVVVGHGVEVVGHGHFVVVVSGGQGHIVVVGQGHGFVGGLPDASILANVTHT